jgi:SAM-dependent methyltransferase
MKKQWQRLTDSLIGKKEYFYIDPSVYSFFKAIRCCIDKFAKGRILDAGAGRLAFKFIFTARSADYITLDKYVARGELDIVGDLNSPPLKGSQFDTILCLQVIEHTPTPQAVIKNLAALLKDGGVLVLSAPHLAYLHGEPQDYYRFTKHSLVYLVEQCGLKVLEIHPAGSIFGFLFTPISDFMLSYAYPVPIIFGTLFFINSLCIRLISLIDGLIFRNSLMPVNYVLAAQKR